MKTKEKNPDKLGFKSYLGTTLMGTTDSLGAGIMSGLFMMYLTDYAGIGKWGAILGTTLLMVARLFDAVNDPLEGWIMDRARVGKYGKYRPFILLHPDELYWRHGPLCAPFRNGQKPCDHLCLGAVLLSAL